jgi:plasmid stabilization system protein ParE
MPSKPFRFHPEAREEFRDAARWYRARNAVAASEFRAAGSAAVREVVRAPQRWPKYLYGTRRVVLQRFPFSVVYLDDPDVITIIAVAHSKRKPGYWRQRLQGR